MCETLNKAHVVRVGIRAIHFKANTFSSFFINKISIIRSFFPSGSCSNVLTPPNTREVLHNLSHVSDAEVCRLVLSAPCKSLWGRDSRTGYCVGLAIPSLCGNHYVAGFESRLVLLSKALDHTCFIRGQRCKWWSRRPTLASSVISDVKPIIYIYILI